jgi:hypothetical protein
VLAAGGGPAAAGVLQHGGGWDGCRGTPRSRSDPARGGQGCSLVARAGQGCDAEETTTFFNFDEKYVVIPTVCQNTYFAGFIKLM